MKNCPRCSAATKVDGTAYIGATIVRYRKCLNPECGHRFKTTQSHEEYLTEDAMIPHAEPRSSQ